MRAIAKTLAIALAALLIACQSGAEARAPAVLLFRGDGTSSGDVAAIQRLLADEHLDFRAMSSSQLNALAEPEIEKYRLLIFPGGNFETIGNNLNSAATTKIRTAIRNGTNYLGICAGAFFAGNSPFNGLNLTSGVRFGFYAAEARGIRKAAVQVTEAEGQTLDQYWEDGPQLTGWGAVVAKYPDGMPAVVEGSFGKGWVVLTGVHPEAPERWRAGLKFRTSVAADNAYAARLIRAGLDGESLPHY